MRVSTSLAEINVVPLVDVMLVLLVIFMVTAPMMQQGFAVNLPAAKATAIAQTEAPIYVTVPSSFTRDHQVQFGDQSIPIDFLSARALASMKTRASKDVYLRADAAVTYGDIYRVMELLKAAGVVNVALIAQPPRADR